jgi:hypothetical protein
MSFDFFSGRMLVVASMHKKEEIIAPILEEQLNVSCICPPALNTDVLGTFSGEVPREQSAYLTAIKKCELALDQTGYDLAIASEGSFGPHPHAFMLSMNEELLVLLDRKNNLTIKASSISLATNFQAQTIETFKELNDFLERVKFPSHGIIITTSKEDFTFIEKGLTSSFEVKKIAKILLNENGSFYVQTDMRAHLNPSRQKVIEQAVNKLAEKLKSNCPSCKKPGFDCTKTISGLPCEYCHYPTRLAMTYIFECEHCSHEEERNNSTSVQFASQAYCDLCNP